MRVLIFTFEFVPFSGGIATYTREVAAGLTGLGWEVRVLAPSYPDAEAVDDAAPYSVVRMGLRHGGPELFRFVPGTRALRREIRRFAPDVVLLTSDLAHGLGGVVCPGLGVPFVCVVHGSEIAKHFPPTSLKERLQAIPLGRSYRRAARAVCVSRYVRGLMSDAGFEPGKLAVIHNGVDASLVRAPTDSEAVGRLRERWRLRGRTTLLTIARLVERKGQAAMIRALPRVLDEQPDVTYVVAGTGEDRSRLEGLALELGVEDAVVFTGEIAEADKVPLIDACDVYVLPSRHDGRRVEGLGIALLEGAARGKPLIGGRHGGVPEIVEDGVTGYLVDGRDPQDIAAAVLRVLNASDRGRSLGAVARDKVRGGFLTEHMAAALSELLEASARPSASSPV